MSEDLRKLVIDGEEIEVPGTYTLLQACEAAGAEIPRFCYHERLSIAGNCRMCLVEWVGAPKPQASCALSVRDLRPNRDGSPAQIRTNSETVKKAREGVMEFLLINHPLDCPICDQGGECDLQDQALFYGRSHSRYEENKRAVEDKHMGPLIKTIMTRCIQCTRCVRFAAEVAGVEELGAIGRGEDMEITTYLEASMTSELSGNVIDLCPVGALTSKPYAFNARPWELKKTETVDVMDALGSSIRVDARGPEVMRIMPRVNEAINEEWISDKTRFVWDGLKRQRLDRPYVRENGALRPASWSEALDKAANALSAPAEAIAALAGDLCDAESLKALGDLMRAIGTPHVDARPPGSVLGLAADGTPAARASYLFNTTLYGVEDADACLLVGTNPRREAPVLNARLRKAWLHRDLAIGAVGETADLTYPVAQIGEGPDALDALLNGQQDFRAVLDQAQHPMLILGEAVFERADARTVLAKLARLAGDIGAVGASDWCGWNVLHRAAARVGALDLGFLPTGEGRDTQAVLDGAREGAIRTVYLLGVDEYDLSDLKDAFVIYQGHHGDRGAQIADVILPGAAYTEKPGLYVNTEGRVQAAERAVFPKGEAKEDWAILRALSERIGRTLPYDNLEALRLRLFDDRESFSSLDDAPGPAGAVGFDPAVLGAEGAVSEAPFRSPITRFHLTNPIARASKIMAECAVLADNPPAVAPAQAAE
ncbi:MAG: NADH-quinone oxidoreductase subunit NuoG [Maricaulaceae bacterium]